MLFVKEGMKHTPQTFKNVPAVTLNGTSKVIACHSSMETALLSQRGGQWVHIDGKWDLLIAHPPCTYLCVTGNRWFNTDRYGKKAENRWKDRVFGAVLFMRFVAADCDKIAIENPIGIMGSAYRKADQIIQPYEYGHNARKATCLWLKNLPKLIPTAIVDPGEIDCHGLSAGAGATYARDENGKILSWNDPRTAKERSKTYRGIAEAMAEQWGNL